MAGGLAGGCEKPPPPPEEKIHVVATLYALADIAAQVGGERVQVEWFLEAGQPLGPLDETLERRQKFRNANLFISRGQFDPWTLQGIGSVYGDRRIIRIDTLPAAQMTDFTHYLWIDPRIALELASEVATRLSRLDAENAAYYQANAERFSRQVADLMESASRRINEHGGGLFATLDPNFLPLARRFALQEVPLPPVSVTDPTPYGVKSVRESARQAGARAMFASIHMPIALKQDWERRLSMPLLPLVPVGSSSSNGFDTYVAMLKHNLEQLTHGVEVSGVPAPVQMPVYADPGLELPTTTPEDAARQESEKIFNTRPVFKVPLPATRPAATSPFRPIPLDVGLPPRDFKKR